MILVWLFVDCLNLAEQCCNCAKLYSISEKRQAEAARIREKYPDRIPVKSCYLLLFINFAFTICFDAPTYAGRMRCLCFRLSLKRLIKVIYQISTRKSQLPHRVPLLSVFFFLSCDAFFYLFPYIMHKYAQGLCLKCNDCLVAWGQSLHQCLEYLEK